MTSEPILTGGCQCGAIRFALSVAPFKVSICHCRMCQKAAGAPFASFADVETGGFSWTRGKPARSVRLRLPSGISVPIAAPRSAFAASAARVSKS